MSCLPDSAEQSDRTMAAGGIRRLELPVPYPSGTVNAYLIEDDPLTLVDCGSNWMDAYDALERSLAGHGYALADIELLVLTHQHMDHLGLAATVHRQGARVACVEPLARYVERWHEAKVDDDSMMAAEMLRHGVPSAVAEALRATYPVLRSGGSAAPVDVVIPVGGRLELRERALHFLHRPGHSPTDTLVWDERHGIAFAGDHLLSVFPSDPIFASDLDRSGGARPFRGMTTYRRSLQQTRSLDVRLLLPGHGPPVADHRVLIDHRIGRQDDHMAQLVGLLSDGRPQSAYELAMKLFAEFALSDPLVAVSIAAGHLELLEDAGDVRREVEHERVSFVRVGASP